MLKRHRLQIICSVTGMVLGYVLLHPYTMLVSALLNVSQEATHPAGFAGRIPAFYHPLMLPMAISFTLFGGFIGLLVGILLNRKRELWIVEQENEKKRVALETLKEIMVTLSHHLLNANMIIGGKVRHGRKFTTTQEILTTFDGIEEQARKIDAVINALRKTTEIKVAPYIASGTTQMIDIAREIEEEMARLEKKRNHEDDA
jgi:hypothetical protein